MAFSANILMPTDGMEAFSKRFTKTFTNDKMPCISITPSVNGGEMDVSYLDEEGHIAHTTTENIRKRKATDAFSDEQHAHSVYKNAVNAVLCKIVKDVEKLEKGDGYGFTVIDSYALGTSNALVKSAGIAGERITAYNYDQEFQQKITNELPINIVAENVLLSLSNRSNEDSRAQEHMLFDFCCKFETASPCLWRAMQRNLIPRKNGIIYVTVSRRNHTADAVFATVEKWMASARTVWDYNTSLLFRTTYGTVCAFIYITGKFDIPRSEEYQMYYEHVLEYDMHLKQIPYVKKVASAKSALAPEPTSLAPEPASLVPEPAYTAPEPAYLAPEPASRTLAPASRALAPASRASARFSKPAKRAQSDLKIACSWKDFSNHSVGTKVAVRAPTCDKSNPNKDPFWIGVIEKPITKKVCILWHEKNEADCYVESTYADKLTHNDTKILCAVPTEMIRHSEICIFLQQSIFEMMKTQIFYRSRIPHHPSSLEHYCLVLEKFEPSKINTKADVMKYLNACDEFKSYNILRKNIAHFCEGQMYFFLQNHKKSIFDEVTQCLIKSDIAQCVSYYLTILNYPALVYIIFFSDIARYFDEGYLEKAIEEDFAFCATIKNRIHFDFLQQFICF